MSLFLGLGNSHRDRRVEGSLNVPREQNEDVLKQGPGQAPPEPVLCSLGWARRVRGGGQVKGRKDGSPSGRNSISKGMDVGGKTMGREGLKTEGGGRGHACTQPVADRPWTWVIVPAGTEKEETHHQARRPPRALDAFEANVSRGALREAEENVQWPLEEAPPAAYP